MVDALVLEASTSVCGFESHLPHQKKKGTERCLFLLVPRHLAMPNAARCGGDFRFAPSVAGTCGSPTRPLPFCDTIQFAIETDRSCHRQRPGAEWCSGLFSLPQICAPVPADPNLPGSKKAPERVSSFGLYHRLPQDSPSRTRAAERHSKTIHSSLFTLLSSLVPPRPSPPTPWESQRAAQQGAEDQFPGGNAGLQNALSPRTAPHAGHRLILNPCRRAALRNSSLFPIHSPSPAPFSLRDGQQNKNIFCFLVT